MSCQNTFFNIYRGDNVNQMFVINKNSLSVDLSAALEIVISLLNDDSTCLVASKTNGKITLGGSQGTINLILDSTDTANLQLTPQPVDVDVVVTDSGGKIQTYRCPLCLMVVDRTC